MYHSDHPFQACSVFEGSHKIVHPLYSLTLEHFNYLQKRPVPTPSSYPSRPVPFPYLWATTSLFPASVNLPVVDISYTSIQMTYDLCV